MDIVMSQPRSLVDISKPAPTDHKPVPTGTDAHAETTKLDNGRGADRSARRADTAPVIMALPRVAETITSASPRDPLPAQRPPVTTTPRAPGAPASDASVPGGKLGQYEVIRQIGRGGMGTVYLARDLRLGRLVAIKLLARLGSYDNARFLAESRVTARCNHVQPRRHPRRHREQRPDRADLGRRHWQAARPATRASGRGVERRVQPRWHPCRHRERR